MLKNLLYAILLGVGMAACLADRDDTAVDSEQDTTRPETIEVEPEPAPDPAEYIIAKGRVGSIQIGMPIDEMQALALPGRQLKDTTLSLEGQDYTAYVVSDEQSSKGLVVEQQCEPACQVWRIRIQSPDYQTAEGIGIGSKYGEVQQHYPISYASLGDAGFVAVSEEAGMSFILDISKLNKIQLHNLKPADIPANTLVKGILVY